MFNFLRKQPDLSGMAADLGEALLERMNAPAPDKAKDGLSVSREDLEHTIKRIDAAVFDNECEINAAEIVIQDRKIANEELAARRKQALASIAVLDKAAADLDALVRAAAESVQSKPTRRRSRKAEQAEA